MSTKGAGNRGMAKVCRVPFHQHFHIDLSSTTLFFLTMLTFLYSLPVSPGSSFAEDRNCIVDKGTLFYRPPCSIATHQSVICQSIERHLPFPNHYLPCEPDYQPSFPLTCSPNAICLLRTPSDVSWARFRFHYRRISARQTQ